MGLEWLSPGIGVFQRMFFTGPAAGSPFQLSGSVAVATPDASAPRNDGQFAVGASCASRAEIRRISIPAIMARRLRMVQRLLLVLVLRAEVRMGVPAAPAETAFFRPDA